VTSLDPNIRPSLIRSRDGYLARLDRLVEMADVVKLSDDDLAWLAPEGGFEDFAAGWLKKGAKVVILTRGGDGAIAVTKTLLVSVPAVDVTVADTIGAGDTFSAAFLARLEADRFLDKQAIADLNEEQLRDLLGYAARAAAITSSRPGADPPWRKEME